MGDFVKGKDYESYPALVKAGVLLHREIDSYTDKHPIVRESKNRLKDKYRHYAGVIVDVFYDHFLANHFGKYCDDQLNEFVEHHYQNLEDNFDLLPPRAQGMLPYMIRGNWLVNYKETRGIQKSLQGMSRRTKFDSKMDESIMELVQYHDEFESEFLAFFPQIIDHANQFREDLLNSHSW